MSAELISIRKQRAFAWAKYYEQVNNSLREAHGHFKLYTATVGEDLIPEHIKSQIKEMTTALKKKWDCPICLDMIEGDNLDITNCGHYYCKPCLQALKSSQKAQGKPKWECAVCRKKCGYKADE